MMERDVSVGFLLYPRWVSKEIEMFAWIGYWYIPLAMYDCLFIDKYFLYLNAARIIIDQRFDLFSHPGLTYLH